MPILFYVAAHLLAQLRKYCDADCLNPRQLLLYVSLPHIPRGSKPAAKEQQIFVLYFFGGSKKGARSRQQIWAQTQAICRLKLSTKRAPIEHRFRYNRSMTVQKPSNNDSSVIGPDDADNLPQRFGPYVDPTSAGQQDPRAGFTSELFALRSEIAKSNQKKTQDLSLSYDEVRGVLSVGSIEIVLKPTSKQGLVCGFLLRNKRNMSRSWTPRSLSKGLDPNNPDLYSEKTIVEAVRHINTKIQTHGLPKLILRSEGRVRIAKTYL